MQEATNQIERIEAKVQQLLKEYQLAQKEVARLQKENTQLRNALVEQQKKTSDLNQTIDVIKINALTTDDGSKRELEKRINTYLKEIDRCLALLQS